MHVLYSRRDERALPTDLPGTAARDRDGARARAAGLAALRQRSGRAGRIDDVRATSRSCSTRASTRCCSATRTTGRICSRRPPSTSRRWRASSASSRPRSARSAWTTSGMRAALGVAVACGAAFMREVLPGVYESDMGLWETDAAALLRERRAYDTDDLCVLMNVTPEFASPLGSRPSGCVPAPRPSRRWPTRSWYPGRWRAPSRRSRRCARSPRQCRARARPAGHRRERGQHRGLRAVHRRCRRRERPEARRRHLGPGRARARPALSRRRPERLSEAVLLGLDLGTTAVKAVVLDPERGLLAARSLRTRRPRRSPGASEQDAGAWLGNALELIPLVCADAGVSASADRRRRRRGLRALCRAPRRPRRAPASRAALERRPRARRDRRVARRAGRCERPGADGRGRHAAIRRAQAALAAAPRARGVGSHPARGGVVRLARRSLAEAQFMSETGRSRVVSTTSLQPLCAGSLRGRGCRQRPLRPDPRPAEVVGGISAAVAERTGVRAGTPVVAGIADHVSSAFAAGLARHGDRSSSSAAPSTCWPAAIVRCWTPASISTPTPPPACGCRTAAWRAAAQACAGPARARSRSGSRSPRRGGRGHPPGADGVVMLPYLLGEKTPLNDPLASGALVGLRLGHRRGHLCRPCSRASPTACGTTSKCWPSTACAPRELA